MTLTERKMHDLAGRLTRLRADAERDELREALRMLLAAKWGTPEYTAAAARAVALVSG